MRERREARVEPTSPAQLSHRLDGPSALGVDPGPNEPRPPVRRLVLRRCPGRDRGRIKVAELFQKVAEEEYFGHFTEQALELGQIGMEAENLHLAIEEEAFEAQVMYRDFQAQAEAVGDHAASERFRRLREDERRNRDQFLAVLRALDPADPAE